MIPGDMIQVSDAFRLLAHEGAECSKQVVNQQVCMPGPDLAWQRLWYPPQPCMTLLNKAVST